MNKKDIFREIGSIDEKFVLEADTDTVKTFSKNQWTKVASLVACFALLLGIGISLVYNQSNKIELTDSSINATAKYVSKAPNVMVSEDLLNLSEEELFTEFNTSVFKGTISEINNIEINLNGSKEYRAVAQITVEKVYRGECNVGDTVSALLPCPINEGVWVEDTETVSVMKIGMKGIFMPDKYSQESYYEANGARLALTDIADYGFPDGERYAFLETGDGIVFSKWAYESIKNATTLEEIETYVQSMLK